MLNKTLKEIQEDKERHVKLLIINEAMSYKEATKKANEDYSRYLLDLFRHYKTKQYFN